MQNEEKKNKNLYINTREICQANQVQKWKKKKMKINKIILVHVAQNYVFSCNYLYDRTIES